MSFQRTLRVGIGLALAVWLPLPAQAAGWLLGVGVEQAQVTTLTLGMAEGAGDGFDSLLDRTAPGRPPESVLGYVALVNSSVPVDLSCDVRGVSDTAVWRLVVQAGDLAVELSWDTAAAPTDHTLSLRETDADGLPLGTAPVRMAVTDSLEVAAGQTRYFQVRYALNAPPVFSQDPYAFTIDENVTTGTAVGTVAATDPDADAVTYSITGGNGAGRFAIGALSGQIVTAGAIDFESCAAYVLTVTAQDNGVGLLTDTAEVRIAVRDLNDPPQPAADALDVNEDAATPNLYATLLATDSDPDAGDSLRIVAVNTTGTLGPVSLNTGSQTLTYTATHASLDSLDVGETAATTFGYTVADTAGVQRSATVTVTVHGVNDPPAFTNASLVYAADTDRVRVQVTGWSDPEGAAEVYYYLWKINGLVAGYGEAELPSEAIVPGQILSCRVTAFDGVLTGTAQETAPLVVMAFGAGWNAISFPITPAGESVAAVLTPAERRSPIHTGQVYAWDPVAEQYLAATRFAALTGYWVRVETAVRSGVVGSAVADPTVTLSAGWHLLGPALPMPVPTTIGLVRPAWRWLVGTGLYTGVTQMAQGEAVWWYLPAAATVRLSPAGP